MPYARDGEISQAPLDGGIEITQEEYGTALDAMMAGRVAGVTDGRLAIREATRPGLPPDAFHRWDDAAQAWVEDAQARSSAERSAAATAQADRDRDVLLDYVARLAGEDPRASGREREAAGRRLAETVRQAVS